MLVDIDEAVLVPENHLGPYTGHGSLWVIRDGDRMWYRLANEHGIAMYGWDFWYEAKTGRRMFGSGPMAVINNFLDLHELKLALEGEKGSRALREGVL